MKFEDLPKKFKTFCKKYPETVVGYDGSLKLYRYCKEHNIAMVVDFFEVCKLIELHKIFPRRKCMKKFKNLRNDWNNLVKDDKK